jgi:hypothetical protein
MPLAGMALDPVARLASSGSNGAEQPFTLFHGDQPDQEQANPHHGPQHRRTPIACFARALSRREVRSSACTVNSRRVGGSRTRTGPEAPGGKPGPYGAGRRGWQQRKAATRGQARRHAGLVPPSRSVAGGLSPGVTPGADGAPRGRAMPMTTPRPRSGSPSSWTPDSPGRDQLVRPAPGRRGQLGA